MAADDDDTTTTATREAPERFTREELIEGYRSHFEDIPQIAVVGALSTDDRETFTLKQAQSIVQAAYTREHES